MVKANIMDGYDRRAPGVPLPGHGESAVGCVEQVFIVILTGVEQRAGQDGAGGDSCEVGAGAAGILGGHRNIKRGGNL